MPSAPTARRVPRRSASRAYPALIALIVVGFAAGCVSDRAEDQRMASTREATRGAILGDTQATAIAERIRLPTPTPAPTLTTAPALANLVLASSVNSDGSPQNEIRSVPLSAGTIYAAAEISHLQAGQTVIAIWTTADGTELARSEQRIESSSSRRWVALPWSPGGLPPGTYAVFIYVDDFRLNSLTFRAG